MVELVRQRGGADRFGTRQIGTYVLKYLWEPQPREVAPDVSGRDGAHADEVLGVDDGDDDDDEATGRRPAARGGAGPSYVVCPAWVEWAGQARIRGGSEVFTHTPARVAGGPTLFMTDD